jgi:hypothetical protein
MITYTTAPRDYDWGWTRELDGCAATDKRGRPVRKVVTIEGRGELQRDRYGSGLHMAVDEVEFRKLVDYGLVKLELPRHCLECAQERGVAIPARGTCSHEATS